MKRFISDILDSLLSNAINNRNRARKQFKGLTPEQMATEYGESGKTCQYILDSYESDVAELKKTIIWVKNI